MKRMTDERRSHYEMQRAELERIAELGNALKDMRDEAEWVAREALTAFAEKDQRIAELEETCLNHAQIETSLSERIAELEAQLLPAANTIGDLRRAKAELQARLDAVAVIIEEMHGATLGCPDYWACLIDQALEQKDG